MSAIIKSEMISRRKLLSLVGLAAAFSLAAAPTVLTVSDAEAQTAGMMRLARCRRRGDRAVTARPRAGLPAAVSGRGGCRAMHVRCRGETGHQRQTA